jgi:hypothetical protein
MFDVRKVWANSKHEGFARVTNLAGGASYPYAVAAVAISNEFTCSSLKSDLPTCGKCVWAVNSQRQVRRRQALTRESENQPHY